LRDWVRSAAYVAGGTALFLLLNSPPARSTGIASTPRGRRFTPLGMRRLMAVFVAHYIWAFYQHEPHKKFVEQTFGTTDAFAQSVLECLDPYGVTCYRELASLSYTEESAAVFRTAPVALWDPNNPRVYRSWDEQTKDGAPVFPSYRNPLGAQFVFDDMLGGSYIDMLLPRIQKTSWRLAALEYPHE